MKTKNIRTKIQIVFGCVLFLALPLTLIITHTYKNGGVRCSVFVLSVMAGSLLYLWALDSLLVRPKKQGILKLKRRNK